MSQTEKSTNSSFRKFVILGIVLIIFAVTNPKKDDFVEFLSKEVGTKKFIVAASLEVLGIERDNFIFFSKYSFYNLSREKVEVYGLLGKVFFKL